MQKMLGLQQYISVLFDDSQAINGRKNVGKADDVDYQ